MAGYVMSIWGFDSHRTLIERKTLFTDLGELNKEEEPSLSLIISSLLIILSVLLPS